MRILLAEDDRALVNYLQPRLEKHGNSVDVEQDGPSALTAAQRRCFDALILDVTLPQIDGLDVTRRIRAAHDDTPILLLTSSDAPCEIIRSLDAGADDCLAKPLQFDVLLARLRARTRSSHTQRTKLLFADLVIDVTRREAWRGKKFLRLTRTEFAILECLMRSAGRVTPRRTLISEVWGPGRDVGANNLDAFMRLLRSKVDSHERPQLIHTLRGVGYSIQDPR